MSSELGNKLDNKTALITGAGSGIGRASAQVLASAGAKVAVADINMQAAVETVDLITANGGQSKPFFVDIADYQTVLELYSNVNKDVGHVDILINNAGWDLAQPFVDTNREFWEKVISINLMGPIAVTHTFLKEMIAEQSGRIINISSDAGRVGSMGETVYAGAKGGIIAFSKSLAREMARYNIMVNVVCPGPTDTPFLQAQPEKIRDALLRAIPLRRLAQPDDIASAVLFLASDAASYITGQVLSVSGGLTMSG
ncbi:MAG: SDR family oxidoreductase [Actinobacteria bacterium]|nr:SDR family oxidoreductase [Actinomycetota bacterium]MCL6104300.1 SDR family oxidoreductase [Actinomycetota bacterium]